MVRRKLKLSIGYRIKRKFFQLFNKYYLAPRYYIMHPCTVTVIKFSKSFPSTIVNISRTGVFIQCDKKIPKGLRVDIEFTYGDEHYLLNAEQVSNHTIIDQQGVGLQFIFDKYHSDQHEIIDQLIDTIESQDPPVPTNQQQL